MNLHRNDSKYNHIGLIIEAINMLCPNTDPTTFQSLLENSGDITSRHYVVKFKIESHADFLESKSKIEEQLDQDSTHRNWVWLNGTPNFDATITVYYAYAPNDCDDYDDKITIMNSKLKEHGFEPEQFNFDKFSDRLSWCGHIYSIRNHECCPAHRCLCMQPIRYAT